HLGDLGGGRDEREGEVAAVGVERGRTADLVLVPGGGGAVEHLGAALLTVGGGEGATARGERLRPGCLQVQGVDQHQARGGAERVRGGELLDAVIRAVGR